MTIHKYYQAMRINELLKAINYLKVLIRMHEGSVVSKITFTPVKNKPYCSLYIFAKLNNGLCQVPQTYLFNQTYTFS